MTHTRDCPLRPLVQMFLSEFTCDSIAALHKGVLARQGRPGTLIARSPAQHRKAACCLSACHGLHISSLHMCLAHCPSRRCCCRCSYCCTATAAVTPAAAVAAAAAGVAPVAAIAAAAAAASSQLLLVDGGLDAIGVAVVQVKVGVDAADRSGVEAGQNARWTRQAGRAGWAGTHGRPLTLRQLTPLVADRSTATAPPPTAAGGRIRQKAHSGL